MLESPALLITDDDVLFRRTLQEVLEPQGYRIHLAGDGQEALEIVERQPIHLLLLDMHMPRLTGLETIRRVRQFSEVLPCVLLSAELDAVMVQQATQLHAFSVLRKPVTRQQITGVVRDALQTTYHWRMTPDGPVLDIDPEKRR